MGPQNIGNSVTPTVSASAAPAANAPSPSVRPFPLAERQEEGFPPAKNRGSNEHINMYSMVYYHMM